MPDLTDEELVARYGGWGVDHDSKAIFRGWAERRLLVNRCAECGLFHQPPGPVCPHCWSWNVAPSPVSGKGTIFMFVLLHQGPAAEGVDYTVPYPVVTVELDDQPGLRLTGTVVGASNDEIRIGRRAEVTWIERSGASIPAFRMVAS